MPSSLSVTLRWILTSLHHIDWAMAEVPRNLRPTWGPSESQVPKPKAKPKAAPKAAPKAEPKAEPKAC